MHETPAYLYKATLQWGAPLAAHSTSTTRSRCPSKSKANWPYNVSIVAQIGLCVPCAPVQSGQRSNVM